ncbi:MAG: dihydroorotate dehydrogenase [bacterium]
MKPDLSVNVGGLALKNPVVAASGTFGYGDEFAGIYDISRLGGITVKGLSLEPSPGNPPPRTVETPAGMLNAIGLENIGVKAFVDKKLPYLRKFDTKVMVNIYGKEIEDYVAIAAQLDGVPGVDALELNISCPNVSLGGIAFGTDALVTEQLVSEVRKRCSLPLLVKLSPNVTDIVEIAKAAENAGADALSLINTLRGMALDIKSRKPVLANITGGLSGPAIRPVAVRMVWQVARAVRLPIIGMGGILETRDAIEFLIAGATAVAVGTANFVNPRAGVDIVEGIDNYLRENGIYAINELIGSIIDY